MAAKKAVDIGPLLSREALAGILQGYGFEAAHEVRSTQLFTFHLLVLTGTFLFVKDAKKLHGGYSGSNYLVKLADGYE